VHQLYGVGNNLQTIFTSGNQNQIRTASGELVCELNTNSRTCSCDERGFTAVVARH
jgi:hypothetical protein